VTICPPPTLVGFITFIRNVMGINTTVLPDDSFVIGTAFQVALEIVNLQLNCASAVMYTLAVYNLAGDNLLNYAQDLPDADVVPGSGDPGMAFFAWTRQQLDLNGFISGVITSVNDQGTGNSMIVQEAAKNFTLSDLQNLKTPYGRQYLAIAQRAGPTIIGLS
jgi:hypothetical protein